MKGGGRGTIDGQRINRAEQRMLQFLTTFSSRPNAESSATTAKAFLYQIYKPQRGSTKKPFFRAREGWRNHLLRAGKQHRSVSVLSSGGLPSKWNVTAVCSFVLSDVRNKNEPGAPANMV